MTVLKMTVLKNVQSHDAAMGATHHRTMGATHHAAMEAAATALRHDWRDRQC